MPAPSGEVEEGSFNANMFCNLPGKQRTTSTSKQASENLPEMQDKLQNLLHLLMVPHLQLFDVRTFTSLNIKQFWELMHWHC